MKIAFAGVLGGLQSLAHDDSCEKAVDRLGALGMIGRRVPDERHGRQVARAKETERTSALCSLGVDLIRFKFARIADARLDAEDQLAAALTWRHKADDLSGRQQRKVACWAVQEWAGDLCPPRPKGCGGAGEVPDHDLEREGTQPMRSCPVCRGTGMSLWTDAERIEAMGHSFAVAMSEAHASSPGPRALQFSAHEICSSARGIDRLFRKCATFPRM
jgi:hypothetical protein